MNKEQIKIMIEILDKMIDRENEIVKRIAILEMQNMLLNKKINILKNNQCKRCCKCSK